MYNPSVTNLTFSPFRKWDQGSAGHDPVVLLTGIQKEVRDYHNEALKKPTHEGNANNLIRFVTAVRLCGGMSDERKRGIKVKVKKEVVSDTFSAATWRMQRRSVTKRRGAAETEKEKTKGRKGKKRRKKQAQSKWGPSLLSLILWRRRQDNIKVDCKVAGKAGVGSVASNDLMTNE